MIATAFAISGLLAGVSGLLWVAQRGSVDPLIGYRLCRISLHRRDPGRHRQPAGRRVIGGFCLGFIEIGLQALLPDPVLPFRDAVALLLVILLPCRPQGLVRVAGAVRP